MDIRQLHHQPRTSKTNVWYFLDPRQKKTGTAPKSYESSALLLLVVGVSVGTLQSVIGALVSHVAIKSLENSVTTAALTKSHRETDN